MKKKENKRQQLASKEDRYYEEKQGEGKRGQRNMQLLSNSKPLVRP